LNTLTLKLIYGFYNFMSLYGLPLLIMIFCYARIFLRLALNASGDTEKNNNEKVTMIEHNSNKQKLIRNNKKSNNSKLN
jgi:hypothetical protein